MHSFGSDSLRLHGVKQGIVDHDQAATSTLLDIDLIHGRCLMVLLKVSKGGQILNQAVVQTKSWRKESALNAFCAAPPANRR